MSIKRINKCLSFDEHYGCAISPSKKCNCCPNAEWITERIDVPKTKSYILKTDKTKYNKLASTFKTIETPQQYLKTLFFECAKYKNKQFVKDLQNIISISNVDIIHTKVCELIDKYIGE